MELRTISNVLLVNTQCMSSPGLLDGRMGVSLFFYHYSRYINKQYYEDFASVVLDSVVTDISGDMPMDTLAGIGLGVGYLLQQNFVEGNPDELLEELDRVLLNQEYADYSSVRVLYAKMRREEKVVELSDLLNLVSGDYADKMVLSWRGLNVLYRLSKV